MKNYKFIAVLLCAAMLMTSAAGCKKDKTSTSGTSDSISVNSEGNTQNSDSSSNSSNREIGKNEIKAEIAGETVENDTVFKLKSVLITPEAQPSSEGDRKFVYLDVDITNNTDTSYDINSLNNFMLILPDGKEILSHIEARFYATENFKENLYIPDPLTIPANGTFSGIVGGFRVPPETDSFTICFFPTGEDLNNKESVIKIDVASNDIKNLSSDILK